MKLQLHRSRQKPDWELIATSKQNWWQRLAATTKGTVTPANFLTLLGLALVGYGIFLLPSQLLVGVGFIAVGRLFDLLDGLVADATGTKGPVGEFVDAAADKLAMFGTGIALGVFGFVNWGIIILLLLLSITNVTLGYRARKHGIMLQPSGIGKVATALQWVGIIALVAAHALPGLQPFAYGIIIAAFIASGFATRDYARTAYPK